jgi:hypothetical protein
MGVMRDRAYSDPDALLTAIVQLGIARPTLRDELYLQVVKQLTACPSAQSQHLGRAALTVLLASFPPSDEMVDYLEVFLTAASAFPLSVVMHASRARWRLAPSGDVAVPADESTAPRVKLPTVAAVASVYESALGLLSTIEWVTARSHDSDSVRTLLTSQQDPPAMCNPFPLPLYDPGTGRYLPLTSTLPDPVDLSVPDTMRFTLEGSHHTEGTRPSIGPIVVDAQPGTGSAPPLHSQPTSDFQGVAAMEAVNAEESNLDRTAMSSQSLRRQSSTDGAQLPAVAGVHLSDVDASLYKTISSRLLHLPRRWSNGNVQGTPARSATPSRVNGGEEGKEGSGLWK